MHEKAFENVTCKMADRLSQPITQFSKILPFGVTGFILFFDI